MEKNVLNFVSKAFGNIENVCLIYPILTFELYQFQTIYKIRKE